MKIKNRDLLRKYVLYERGIWEKPRNFPLLLAAAKRRIGWGLMCSTVATTTRKLLRQTARFPLSIAIRRSFAFPRSGASTLVFLIRIGR